jgi:methyl-accepting chemotaxis protein
LSDIFKKITSIENDDFTPDDREAVKALKLRPASDPDSQGPIDDDPMPEFITRETPVKKYEDILEEKILSDIPSAQGAGGFVPSALAVSAAAPTAYIPAPSTSWMKWVGIGAVILWLGASFAYMYGFFDLGRKWADLTPIQIAGLVLAVLFPAILLGLLFYALRQLSRFSRQAHLLSRAANALTQPDDSTVAKTAIMSRAIKTEVDSVDARIDQAIARMSTLESVISEQTQGLSAATAASAQTADDIASRLSTQRLALENIASTFDVRMATLSAALTDHSDRLAESTHMAEQKIQEARISVEGAAAKINSASEIVRSNTVEAASTLTQSHEDIENLAEMIRTRSAELDEVYRKHAQDLTSMIEQLRDEQQNLGHSLEERLTKMRDMSLSAKVSAESLTEASEAGRQTVEALAEATRLTDTAVKQRFADMEDMVKFSSEKAESISDKATRRVQDSLAQTRKEIARIETDMAALQMRLSQPQPGPALDLEDPKQPKPKRRGLLRFKPLAEDFPPVVPPRFEPARLEIEPPELHPAPNATTDILEETKSHLETLELTDDQVTRAIVPEALPETVADISPDKADTLRRAAPEEASRSQRRKKDKSGWHWRDMLGGLERPDETSAIDALTAPTPREVPDSRMIASLAALGLTPAAIVDDGCIIEAANTRKAKDAAAMSHSVARRLGDPVRHLHRAMEENPALKADAETYVAEYQARMSVIDSNREAIRASLESDGGRAFLLCDAALNG